MFRIASLVSALALFVPLNALACSCAGLPHREEAILEYVEQAQYVVLARVTERVMREWIDDDGKRFESRVRVYILEQFKGADDSDELVLDPGPGTCMASLRPGAVYLVFAQAPERDGGPLLTSKCSTYIYEYERATSDSSKLQARLDPVLEILRSR